MRQYFFYNLVAIAAFFGLICLWSTSVATKDAHAASLVQPATGQAF